MERCKKLNVVLVGLGNIGLEYDFPRHFGQDRVRTAMSHLGSLIDVGDVHIAALVDLKEPPQLRKLGLTSKFIQWDAFQEMRMKIDLLIVATPTHTHMNTIAAIVRNHEVAFALIEKPVGNNEEEAIKIAEVLSKENVAWLPNYHRSLFPSFRRAMEVVHNGGGGLVKAEIFGWGQLRNIHSHFLHLLGNLCGFSMLEEISWDVTDNLIRGRHRSGSQLVLHVLNEIDSLGRILTAEFEHISFLADGNGETFRITFHNPTEEPVIFEEPDCQAKPQSVVLREILSSTCLDLQHLRKGVVEVHRTITNIENAILERSG